MIVAWSYMWGIELQFTNKLKIEGLKDLFLFLHYINNTGLSFPPSWNHSLFYSQFSL